MAAVQPNETVYIRNLDEKVKIPELIESLREVFGEFGDIKEIIAKKSLRRKGQAFIVYDDLESAKQAVEIVQGFELAGREMEVEFARSKSDATVKKQFGEEAFEAHKAQRIAEKERKQAEEAAAKAPLPVAKLGKRERLDSDEPTDHKGVKILRTTTAAAPRNPAATIPDEFLPPNKILFVQNIPKETSIDHITAIFERFSGFKEVRSVPGRTNIAFVEYDTDANAGLAKEQTSGMAIGDDNTAIKVTFQKK